MRFDQLEHAIIAACDVSADTEVLIFISLTILVTYPDAPASLGASIEVDVRTRDRPEMTDLVDGVLAEGSKFHRTHGYYVHDVAMETSTLPERRSS
jgi:hypothetical protein